MLVLNNCDDESDEVVAAAAKRLPMLAIEALDVRFDTPHAHVGSARRLALETALSLCAWPERSVLLTTDADAVPAPDWIECNLRHLASGIDLVGGLITGDPVEEDRLGPDFRHRARLHLDYARLCDRLASLVDPIDHDPWPRHRDHTGASLAVRADVYAAVGGMPAMPRREDLAFVSRVREAGYRLRHPLDVNVKVSARLAGRAPGGMADCLKEWLKEAAAGLPVLVEDPQGVLRRSERRRLLRQLGEATEAERRLAALRLGLRASDLETPDGRPHGSAVLVERFAPDEPDAAATVPVEVAMVMIEEMILEAEGDVRAA